MIHHLRLGRRVGAQGTDFDINKPGSIDELFDGDEKDREWWETGEPLPDLSQPARNVASWISKTASSDASPGESRRRPRWKFWEPVNLEVALDADPSQDMSLVSHGMTVARLMTQEVGPRKGQGDQRGW